MSAIRITRLLLLPALTVMATSSHAAVNELIFDGGFEINETVPTTPGAEPTFVNQTQQRLDQIQDSEYRFDAMWTDFNSDGCYDAFIYDHGNAPTSRLWVNRCDGSNTFVFRSNASVHHNIAQPDLPRGSGWLSVLDFNGDGLQDFWTRDADTMAARYVNASADGAQVPYFGSKESACNDHCVFADIDGDNQLDIIHPDRHIESMDYATIAPSTGPEAEVIAADIDGDGWADLLQPELGGYWHNQQGQLQWRDTSFFGEPVHYAIADFNNDGRVDLMVFNEYTNTDGEARLYRNDGNGNFTDVTADSGLDALPFNSWWTGYGNTVAADLNNDGLQDLVVGGAERSPSVTIMRNTGGMHFAETNVDLDSAGHGSEAYKGRASVADFDNDGRLDILKTQDETNAGIWRNTTSASGHWMKVRVRGTGLNSDGVGADIKWYRHGTSSLAAHMMVRVGPQHPQTWLHTGVGASQVVDMVVTYPNGGPSYRFDGLASDQEVIVFSNGCLIEHWQPGNGWPLTAPAGCTN